MTRLDTPKRRPYIPTPAWVGLLLLCLAGSAFAESYKGVQLPDGAAQVGEDRFRAPEDCDGTLKYYRQLYPPSTHRWKAIVDQPGVKATHIELGIRGVEGLNIYEANDEVRIFVVPAEGATKTKETKSSRRSKKSQ
jgi:hypothetical protein